MPKLHPANSPKRVDWQFFADVLGLEHAPEPPQDQKEAEEGLKGLMKRTVESSEAYDALLRKALHQQILELTLSSPAHSYAEILRFLKSRMWNRRPDGQLTVSKKGRAHSTNDILLNWDPGKSGAIPYLRFAAKHILGRDWRAETNHAHHQPMPQAGTDPEESDYLVALVEDERAIPRRRGASRRVELDDQRDSAAEEYEMVADDVFSETRARAGLYAAVSRGAMASTLKAGLSPDYPLLAAYLGLAGAPEPGLDQQERDEQLRELAATAMSVWGYTPSGKASARDLVNAWEPSERGFAAAFPEVCRGIEAGLSGGATREPVQVDFLSSVLSAPRHGRAGAVLPEMTEASAKLLASVPDWMSQEAASIEELQSAERPDYIALCALTNTTPDFEAPPGEVAASMKLMVKQLADHAVSQFDCFDHQEERIAILAMNSMKSWKPLQDGYFSECLRATYQDLRAAQPERPARKPRPTRPVHFEDKYAQGADGRRTLRPLAAPEPDPGGQMGLDIY